MRKAIVVGTGAGGATAARELQGAFEVTVLEEGHSFKPLAFDIETIERIKKSHLVFDPGLVHFVFPNMRIRKTADKMVLVNGVGLGGTTTLSAGNALRMDGALQALGINLDPEFEEVYREIPVSTGHQKKWHKYTRQLFHICEEMDLNPVPAPKLGNYERCLHCGHCILGCKQGIKWDSRQYLEEALAKGATLVTGARVERVLIKAGEVTGVETRGRLSHHFYPADLVVLAAGGLGTPVILQNSGIACEPRLFVDPVLCVAAEIPRNWQCKEITMPFVVQREGYILSPYFDFVSFLFNKDWKYPASDILGVMIKLADQETGAISKGHLEKSLTWQDNAKLLEGVELCQEILAHLGIKKDKTFLGTLNAGHPGGMLPLTKEEATTLHSGRLPGNLYIADSTLFPQSLGNPPILTIVALSKRVSRICIQNLAVAT